MWNVVAKETREGAVYHRLLEKLENESKALKGRVFDILGELFEERALKELLMEAIRYGDEPPGRAGVQLSLDHLLDQAHINAILERNALAQETMSTERLYAVKGEMEKAEARKLQPYFVHAYFHKAFRAWAVRSTRVRPTASRSPTCPPSFASATARSRGATAAAARLWL